MTSLLECPVCFDEYSQDDIMMCHRGHAHACGSCLSRITTDFCTQCRADLFAPPKRSLFNVIEKDKEWINERRRMRRLPIVTNVYYLIKSGHLYTCYFIGEMGSTLKFNGTGHTLVLDCDIPIIPLRDYVQTDSFELSQTQFAYLLTKFIVEGEIETPRSGGKITHIGML